ncbi:hypothetical protein DFA_04424 [Cavenderia fasciculata]|uniref:Uncharacterized protein n=1 Tax=Cavenderia fasciculata TaxID=261658 RepID=F4PPJ3_CACFS|nr:uncharacterized protein DFA_04424 [Cavenderia fasciculata]EGG22306.1 hypothetical protein DFA_04424 [Cavenderia fasciculata]|eukprot:XP_004360157.1 hypothetical protein DFA_04424 [Cavenderia fasciculata]
MELKRGGDSTCLSIRSLFGGRPFQLFDEMPPNKVKVGTQTLADELYESYVHHQFAKGGSHTLISKRDKSVQTLILPQSIPSRFSKLYQVTKDLRKNFDDPNMHIRLIVVCPWSSDLYMNPIFYEFPKKGTKEEQDQENKKSTEEKLKDDKQFEEDNNISQHLLVIGLPEASEDWYQEETLPLDSYIGEDECYGLESLEQ